MESLSRFVARAGAALICLAAGCVSPEPVREVSRTLPAPEIRRVLVQTIPRGAWVERDNEYLGVTGYRGGTLRPSGLLTSACRRNIWLRVNRRGSAPSAALLTAA